jgi:integrase
MSYVKYAPRLYVKTSTTGTQSWVYRYKLAKVISEKGLGSFTGDGRAKLTVPQAIKKAEVLSGILATGQDPFGSRARKQMTFAEVAAEIIEINTNPNAKKGWAVKKTPNGLVCSTKQDWLRMIQKDAPRLAKMTFNHPRIEDEVEMALKPIWGVQLKKGEDMRARIAKVFEHAKVRKVFVGENPANRDRIVMLLGEGRDGRSVEQGGDVKNHKSLPFQEVPAAVAALAGRKGVAAAATRFLILTAARTANVQYCSKADIDRQARTWTVSGDGHTGKRMKSGAPHTYYLSDQAMEIVNALWDRSGDTLFTNKDGNPMGGDFARNLLGPKDKGGIEVDATPHGMRSSFGEWVLRNHPEKKAIADTILAHADGKVAKAYFRGNAVEAEQSLSKAWGDFCAPASNVIRPQEWAA